MWAHGPRWEFHPGEGEAWNGFAAVRDLAGLPPEILVIPLYGHTRGHCGVAIRADTGWLLHAGDSFFDPREVHGPRRICAPKVRLFEAAVTTSRSQRAANQLRLRQLITEQPGIDVFSAHDPTHAQLTTAGPASELRPAG